MFVLSDATYQDSKALSTSPAKFRSLASLSTHTSDPLEQEAERIAEQIAGPAGLLPQHSQSRHEDELLRSAGKIPGSGQALHPADREYMESRLGHNFGHVRVHAGSDAERAADNVDALAYTVGSNIVFGAGQYHPGTPGGRRLLAHELTHVVQQSGLRGTAISRQAVSGTMQRAPRNPIDDTAKKIIEAAKDTSKAVDQRAIQAVNDIVKAYYDSGMVDSVVYKEDQIGLETTPIGKGKDIKGKITVGRDFLDHIDSFARRVLQVGHELEHVKQQREGMGGHNKSHEREFLAFYWEATQIEKTGTGRMPHATRVSLIDEALRNYYCLSKDDQDKYAPKKDELLTLRSSEERKGGNDHTDPPTACPSGK